MLLFVAIFSFLFGGVAGLAIGFLLREHVPVEGKDF